MSVVDFGNHHLNVSGAAGAASLVLDPASNVAGAVLRTVTLSVGSAGTSYLFTGPTAPTSGTTATTPVAFRVSNPTGATQETMPYELKLPAGYGVWLWPSSGSNGGSAYLSYDLYTA